MKHSYTLTPSLLGLKCTTDISYDSYKVLGIFLIATNYVLLPFGYFALGTVLLL